MRILFVIITITFSTNTFARIYFNDGIFLKELAIKHVQ